MNTLVSHYSLGEPQVAGPLGVFPVFGPAPRLSYRSFAQATELGALVREVDGGGSVRSLVLENPTDLPLLLYEGEEVLGARQNRTFDESVLVGSGEKVTVEVSCVEAGRWEAARRAEALQPSPQAADPDLRHLKRAAKRSLGHADQREVWAAVATRLADHGVSSPVSAMSDLYDGRRTALHALAKAVRPVEGQVGALASVSGRPMALDLLSRADAFATLLPRLAQGYALAALGACDGHAGHDAALHFLSDALAAPRVHTPTRGLGRGVAIGTPSLVGSGLEHDEGLIALAAFPARS